MQSWIRNVASGLAEDRNKVGSIRYDWNDLQARFDKKQISAVRFFRHALRRDATHFGATRRIVWDSGVAVWDACVALALRRSPCTPALLRATDGDESTRRRASSFLVASGRGCYTLSVRSTTPNWPRTTRRRSHDLPSHSLFLSFLPERRDRRRRTRDRNLSAGDHRASSVFQLYPALAGIWGSGELCRELTSAGDKPNLIRESVLERDKICGSVVSRVKRDRGGNEIG